MYGRNSYLGEGICTHGNDDQKCWECAFLREYKVIAVKRDAQPEEKKCDDSGS